MLLLQTQKMRASRLAFFIFVINYATVTIFIVLVAPTVSIESP